MKNYILNEKETGFGKVFEEDDIQYVYYYDEEVEVEISRELSDDEIETLKEFDTKEEMIEYLKDEGLECGTSYHGESVAIYGDSIILNLDDLTTQTAEEIYSYEPIIIDPTPYNQDPYKVYRLDHENYNTYEKDDIIASLTAHESSFGSKKVDFIYSDNYREPLAVFKDVSNYQNKRTEAKIVDMEECFEMLQEYLEESEIAEVCDYLINAGVSQDSLPFILEYEEAMEI